MWIAKILIRLGGCPGWPESSLGAHSFCWFCHAAAHFNTEGKTWKLTATYINTLTVTMWEKSWNSIGLLKKVLFSSIENRGACTCTCIDRGACTWLYHSMVDSEKDAPPTVQSTQLHIWLICFWTGYWAAAWQNQQNDMCAQRRLRSAWASTQSDQSLHYPHEESLGP